MTVAVETETPRTRDIRKLLEGVKKAQELFAKNGSGAYEIQSFYGTTIPRTAQGKDELTFGVRWHAFVEDPKYQEHPMTQSDENYLQYLGFGDIDLQELDGWQRFDAGKIQFRFRESGVVAGVYLVRSIPMDLKEAVLKQRMVFAKDQNSLEEFLAADKLN